MNLATNLAPASQEKKQTSFCWSALQQLFPNGSDYKIMRCLIGNKIDFNYTAARVISEQTGLTLKTVQNRLKILEHGDRKIRKKKRINESTVNGGFIINTGTFAGKKRRARSPIIWKVNHSLITTLTGHDFDHGQTKYKLRHVDNPLEKGDQTKSKLRKDYLTNNHNLSKTETSSYNRGKIPSKQNSNTGLQEEIQTEFQEYYNHDESDLTIDDGSWRDDMPEHAPKDPEIPKRKYPEYVPVNKNGPQDAANGLIRMDRPKPDDRVWNRRDFSAAHKKRKKEFQNSFHYFLGRKPNFDEVEKWMSVYTPNQLISILENLLDETGDTDPAEILSNKIRNLGGKWKLVFSGILKQCNN